MAPYLYALISDFSELLCTALGPHHTSVVPKAAANSPYGYVCFCTNNAKAITPLASPALSNGRQQLLHPEFKVKGRSRVLRCTDRQQQQKSKRNKNTKKKNQEKQKNKEGAPELLVYPKRGDGSAQKTALPGRPGRAPERHGAYHRARLEGRPSHACEGRLTGSHRMGAVGAPPHSGVRRPKVRLCGGLTQAAHTPEQGV